MQSSQKIELLSDLAKRHEKILRLCSCIRATLRQSPSLQILETLLCADTEKASVSFCAVCNLLQKVFYSVIKYENEATLGQDESTLLYLLGFFVHFYICSLCIEKHWLKKLKYSLSYRMMLLFPSD